MESLYTKLANYKKENIYPFHMPGHKRNEELFQMQNPYSMDITEIDGFDNLQDPEDIILKSMELAASLYHAKHTHYLVNGSTVGLLAAIAACTNKGDKIIVARNCHKSVYNAIYLNELHPVYLYPHYFVDIGINGGIHPENIEELLIDHPDTKAIIITSPTYEGVISDIKAISKIAHARNIPLIVDEAHGAHLGFHEAFPENSNTRDADLVIQSVHKTMPCFTQTALIHNNSEIVSEERLIRFINMYQTTSPSYLFMGNIDQCMQLMKREAHQLFEAYAKRLQWFYEEMRSLKHMRILNESMVSPFEWDPSKIVILLNHTNLTGPNLHDILLENYKIQLEMVSKEYGIAMTSIGDTKEGFERLKKALYEIDESLEDQENDKDELSLSRPVMRMNVYEAYQKDTMIRSIKECEGAVAAEYLYVYPPGIPLLVPGEEISKALVEEILSYQNKGLSVKGFINAKENTIKIVRE